MDDTANQKIIQEIRGRIQFLITVCIFFSGYVYTFYKITQNDEIISQTNALLWGFVVAFSLINYLLVGIAHTLHEKFFSIIRLVVSMNIAFFILPILVFFTIVKNPLPGYYYWPFLISLLGAISAPFLTYVLILGGLYWKDFGGLLKKLLQKIISFIPLWRQKNKA